MKKNFCVVFFHALVFFSGQVLADEKNPEDEKIPVFQSILVKDAGTDSMSTSSTEPREPNEPVLGEACKGFSITEKDVREHLTRAKRILVTSNFIMALPRTRCTASAELTTPDGRKTTMYIERNRASTFVFFNEAGEAEEEYALYCGECQNNAYYDAIPDTHITRMEDVEKARQDAVSGTLEAIMSGRYEEVTIHKVFSMENAFSDSCKGFDLTEAEIRDFFQNARLLKTFSYNDFLRFVELDEFGKSLDSVFNSRRNCVIQGTAILQDEKLLKGKTLKEEKAIFFAISRERTGTVNFTPESILDENQVALYYCDRCQSKKYYAPSGKIIFHSLRHE